MSLHFSGRLYPAVNLYLSGRLYPAVNLYLSGRRYQAVSLYLSCRLYPAVNLYLSCRLYPAVNLYLSGRLYPAVNLYLSGRLCNNKVLTILTVYLYQIRLGIMTFISNEVFILLDAESPHICHRAGLRRRLYSCLLQYHSIRILFSFILVLTLFLFWY